ncbi:MAG: tRNA threonylcarbamoyladenosine dehydratase [Fusobacteriaceae bacterium]
MMFQRTELLLGKEGLEKLKKSHIIVFGLGGVGGYVVEALIRVGIQEITVVDFDTIDITNLNRQIIATQNTVGNYKADVIKERILSINPEVKVNAYREKFTEETSSIFFNDNLTYSYVIDAIDLVKYKIKIIELSKERGIPVISCMGTGNKLNPEMLKISDISKTSVCPLAKVMRKELKKRRINKVKVLYSEEVPKKPINEEGSREKKVNVGSVSFVPSVAGLIIASQVVKDICETK